MVRAFTDLSIPLRRPRPVPPKTVTLPGPPPPGDPEPPESWLFTLLRQAGRAVRRMASLVALWVATVALAGAAIATAVVVAARTAGHITSTGAEAGPTRPITFAPLATRSVIYAQDGSMLTELHAEQDRVPIALSEVPPHVVRAVLDAEDERFFEHGALDVRALLRAFVNNVEAGGVNEGGSTITQQLVKTEMLTSDKDLERKLKEAVLAVQLEEQFTKEEILERYLNSVYFGNGAYGIQAAALHYYGVDAPDLTLGQAVLLAGLIRYPGGSDPFTNPDAARDRREVIADRMHFLGHITAEEAEQVKGEPLPTPRPDRPPEGTDYFSEHVKQELLGAEWLGETADDRYRAVFEGGLRIHTTLDPRAQYAAQATVEGMVPEDPRGFTAALASVDPQTGAVRALVGGKNFDKQKFNLVTDGDGRQTGSSFKMFTLMAALEAGFQPGDTISGSAPCPIDNVTSVDPIWSPSNVEGQGGGTMTLASATQSSVNCAYARLIKYLGPQKVVDVAQRLGITNPLGPHLSLTLGSEPVTPLQMASAYGTVAADGVRHAPYFIDRVEGRDGTVLWRHKDNPVRAVSADHARTVTGVLTGVVTGGTGTAAAVPGRQVAGKTGSADDNADAWFVGYTPQLSTAVWMGAPEGRVSMYNVGQFPRVYGGTYPAMIFGAYMKEALASQPALGFPAPPQPNRGSRFINVPGPSAEALRLRENARRTGASTG